MMRYIIFGCLLFCCNNSQEDKPEIFESILNAYFSEFSIKKDSEIFVSDMKGWTDTTSMIRILNINSKHIESGKIFFTEYEDVKIYLEYGHLENDKITLDFSNTEFSIPSRLKWEIIELTNEHNEIPMPEQFNEVQIIYNPSKNCIEESDMMGRLKFKESLKASLSFCN